MKVFRPSRIRCAGAASSGTAKATTQSRTERSALIAETISTSCGREVTSSRRCKAAARMIGRRRPAPMTKERAQSSARSSQWRSRCVRECQTAVALERMAVSLLPQFKHCG